LEQMAEQVVEPVEEVEVEHLLLVVLVMQLLF
jgi:hypothetical protein